MTRTVIARNTAIITIGLAADKVIGLVKVALAASAFGLSRDMDAFIAALALPVGAAIIASESVSTAALNILLCHRAAGTQQQGWRVLSAFTNTVGLAILAATAIYVIAAGTVVRVVAPGLGGETVARAVFLTRVLAPLVLAQILLGIAQGVLHAAGRFVMPSARLAISNGIAVLALAAFHRSFGITAYAAGMIAGDAIAIAAHLPALRGVGWRWHAVIGLRSAELRRAFAFSAPMLGGATILQVMMIVEKAFASRLSPGSIAGLDYGIRLLVVFYVFERAVTNAIFPALAARFALNSLDRFRSLVAGGVRAHLLVALPLTVGGLLLREPVIRVLLQHGAFDADATALTTQAAAFYLAGLLGMSLRHFMAQVYHARGDSRTPMVTAAVSLALYVMAAKLLAPALGLPGLPLALTLAMTANAALMMAALARADPGVTWRPLAPFAVRVGAAVTAVGGLLWAGRAWAAALAGPWAWAALIAAVAAAAAVYGCVLAWLRTDEALAIGRLGRNLLRRAST
jgi:putative peptidoglycan lipid II flippase